MRPDDHLVPLVRRPFCRQKDSCRPRPFLSLKNITRGPPARDIAALPTSLPIIMHGSSRPNSPALSHFAVRPSLHCLHPCLKWRFDNILIMQWAEGGPLDDDIDAQLGRPTHPSHHGSKQDDDPSSDVRSRSTCIRAMQRAMPSEKGMRSSRGSTITMAIRGRHAPA
jgi:hypothetical protein